MSTAPFPALLPLTNASATLLRAFARLADVQAAEGIRLCLLSLLLTLPLRASTANTPSGSHAHSQTREGAHDVAAGRSIRHLCCQNVEVIAVHALPLG
jgi:hypothetical protein